MKLRGWVPALIGPLLVGCPYDPSFTPGLPCSETGKCPEGQSCDEPSNTCVLTDPPDDDAPMGGDGPPDAFVPIDCSGTFGGQRRVLDDPARISSPALTGDELEVFYVREETAGITEIASSTRGNTSATFPTGTRVAELDDICILDELHTLDISLDGLRAYVVCSTPTPAPPYPMFLATRQNRNAPFTLQGEIGQGGLSPGIDGRELVVYSAESSILVAERSSTSADFPAAQPVPEFAGLQLNTPCLAGDDLTLVAGHPPSSSVRIYQRPSVGDPFAYVADAPRPFTMGSPEMSRDCRSLYFVGLPVAGEQHLYVVER